MEKNEMGGARCMYGVRGGAYCVLVRKPDGKRPLERLGLSWEDNIKMVLQDLG
jgi:hypothetical protein